MMSECSEETGEISPLTFAGTSMFPLSRLRLSEFHSFHSLSVSFGHFRRTLNYFVIFSYLMVNKVVYILEKTILLARY